MSTTTKTHQPSQLPGAVPSQPGILFVLSTILPSTPPLSPEAFCDWYENTHIQEVQSTGGIAHTYRYESLAFRAAFRGYGGPVVQNRGCGFDFVTVYRMPDLAFRESEAFRGLDGQRNPGEELLEGLFRKVEFVTRFAGEVGEGPEGEDGAEGRGGAPFVVTIAPLEGAERELPDVGGVEGVSRVTKYQVHEGSRLHRFERSWLDEPREMAIVELDGEDGLRHVAEMLEKVEGLEIGFWGLRREYDGKERTPKGWKPKAE